MTTLQSILAAAFWCSVAGVAYAYLGYPVLVFALSRVFGRKRNPPRSETAAVPRIALLIAAHNEECLIHQRLENALALEYPADSLQIVVASDGSRDRTVEICRRFEPRVRVHAFAKRAGKASTLNAVIPTLDADIIVLSDANTFMERGALLALARWFADPTIGAVCGRLVLIDALTGRNADGLYWKYETFLKCCEGRLCGPLGANGAIYALRRSLFTPLPPTTILDDFLLPLSAKLRSGCRIVYDATAVAHEETPPQLRDEFRRRVRIAAGAFQSLGILWPLLLPRHGWTALALWSHKILRWFCPLLMVAALASPLSLLEYPFYRSALVAQCAFYALAATITAAPTIGRAFRPLRILPLFAAMNLALLVGFIGWLAGHRSGIWRRTSRTPPAASTV